MKKTLLAIALAAATTTAYADTSISGHVNYILGDLEEFNGNEDITVDNGGASVSRFAIKSSQEAAGVTWGIFIERSIVDGGVGGRQDNLFAQGNFGKFTLGQGSEAGDDAVENDYSGTYLTQGDLGSWGLSDQSGVSGGSDSKFSTPDGGRTENLRYDTPQLGMFSGAVSYDTEDTVSVEAKLEGSMFKASVYVASKGDAAKTDPALVPNSAQGDEVGGSVAVKFGGFTAALQAAQVDEGETTAGADNGADVDYAGVVIGYNVGSISASVDFKTNENDADTLDKETVGLNFVYRPAKGVELYTGYRTVDNKITDTDADGVLFGARVKF
jgi:hypothetical protein